MNSCEEIENICRICLLEAEDLRSIFKTGEVCGEITTLSNMLTECTSIESFPEDGLPQTLCMKCIKELSKMYLFRQKCIKSDSILRERCLRESKSENAENEQDFMNTIYYLEEVNDNEDEHHEEQEDNHENIEEVKEHCEYEIQEMKNENISKYFQRDRHHQQQENQSENKGREKQNSIDGHIETVLTTTIERDNDVVVEEVDEGEEIQNFEQIELYTINEEMSDDENSTTLGTVTMETDENCVVQNSIATSIEEDIISVKSGTIITGSGRGVGGDSDIATDSGTNDDRTEYRLFVNEEQQQHQKQQQQVSTTRRRRGRLSKIPGPPFKCEKCGKILSNHSSYKYHQQLHSDATPFLCSICGDSFKTRNSYEGHMTTHNVNNPHTCKVCGKSYRQAGSLRCHMLTHTGEKPFLCGICGKGMTQKSGFKKHLLTHTGEKPHTCDECGKKFRYSSNLIIHKRGHARKKPYVCKVCDKRFVGGEQLKRHIIIHTDKKPYECEYCKKMFNRKSSLLVHYHLHTGKKKYFCKICGKGYIQSNCLSNHVNSHYKNDDQKLNNNKIIEIKKYNDIKSTMEIVSSVMKNDNGNYKIKHRIT